MFSKSAEYRLNRIKGDILKVDKIVLFLYGLYFVLAPFYLWRSGLPQIADFIIVVTIILYVIKNKFSISIKISLFNFAIVLVLFLCWIILVNLTWAYRLQTALGFFISITFFIYNIIVTLITIALVYEYGIKLLEVVLKSVHLSIIIQFVLFLVNGGYTSVRMTGTFNNPNQLGYYVIISTSLIMFINEELEIKSSILIIDLIISFILVIISLSNAAIISWLIMYVIFLIAKTKNRRTKYRIIAISIFLVTLFFVIYNKTTIIKDNTLFQSIERRLSETDDKVSSLSEERGYNRIKEYPQFWIFGAGEGAYYRFRGYGGEIHSTLGNIQVSYGLIGTIIFLIIIFNVLSKNGYKMWYIIFCIMLYGYSHNGIRNTMFWILLALMVSLGKRNKIVRNEILDTRVERH